MEVWKDIEGYEKHYQVSSFGNIKVLEREVPYKNIGRLIIDEKIMSKKLTKDGYYEITLTKDKIKKSIRVHRLVAKAFLENSNNEPVVNHIDGNKLNNNLENLEWTSHSGNSLHSYKIGTSVNPHKKSVLDTETGEVYDSITEAAGAKGMSNANLSFQLSGHNNRKNKTSLILV